MPEWFQADELFSSDAGWFFGSREGLNIGPYADRDAAEAKGAQVAKRLRALKTDTDRMQFIRKVLHEEWESVGAGSHDGSEDEEIELAPPPPDPVRAGEPQRKWYRAERFFQVDSVWFFSTREGIDVGPFDSEATAKRHERCLVSLLIRTRTPEEAVQVIQEYKHRPELDIKDVEFTAVRV